MDGHPGSFGFLECCPPSWRLFSLLGERRDTAEDMGSGCPSPTAVPNKASPRSLHPSQAPAQFLSSSPDYFKHLPCVRSHPRLQGFHGGKSVAPVLLELIFQGM